jgi:uncharacterized membrane protein
MRKSLLYFTGWFLLIALKFYYISYFALRYFNLSSWNKQFGPILTMHISFGIIAILSGPFQFFPSIRKKNPRIHRITGRIYLLSILIASISAIYLAIFDGIIKNGRFTFGVGLLGLAMAWLLTCGMAFWAVKHRNFVQHREWMVKSYVVTCGFTTYRIFGDTIRDYFQFSDAVDMSGIMAWACWSVPLLITEVILQAKKINNTHMESGIRGS